MKFKKPTLLVQVLIAVALGVLFGQFLPDAIARLFVTFNGLFGNFLTFAIPLIIVGLIIPAIADLGKGAGRMLLLTAVMAYGFTLFSGFFTFFVCDPIFPSMISTGQGVAEIAESNEALKPYFVVDMPPLMNIMTALLLAFCVGLGLSAVKGDTLKRASEDFRDIVTMLISKVIVPLLPLHIFGIFLNMTVTGQVASVMSVFLKIIVVIFILHVVLLVLQFVIAGIVGGKNPFKLLGNMLPAYFTALGTQSSAATIPVTLQQAIKNGVSPNIATFVIPLCATIHLSGSTMKIVACSMAVLIMNGLGVDFGSYAGFICMLGITMVAAPGVPGGAIMAALGVLEGFLGFGEMEQALMIALYIAMDSFGTACNVTGDGAIAVVIDRIAGKKEHTNN
ncbi:MAG: dicarboxylate/amino acid:cation symporter [Bacteroidaceae bacterium]|nr:dicarboxylate/amino acid:cation symporter [Bacteroidaceae bacterium]